MNSESFNFGYHRRKILSFLFIMIFIWSLSAVEWSENVFHSGGFSTGWQMISSMARPNLSSELLSLAFYSTWITLAYAVAGMSIALLLALVFGILASGILAKTNQSRKWMKTIFRGMLSFMRAIHELVWAWLFVASIGLSPFAGIFALAVPYGGILGRIFADMINDVGEEPIKSLKSSGASRIQLLFYGYFPMVRANMTSYAMYRFECAVRSSAIMSFIGLGGLGYQIQLSLDDLQYQDVWTFLYFLIGLVIVIDIWSQLLRKRLTG